MILRPREEAYDAAAGAEGDKTKVEQEGSDSKKVRRTEFANSEKKGTKTAAE